MSKLDCNSSVATAAVWSDEKVSVPFLRLESATSAAIDAEGRAISKYRIFVPRKNV
jgi:hypothetical protein